MKSTIGLKRACYAMLESETETSASYGEVQTIPGSIQIALNLAEALVRQYADDGVFDVYSALGDATIDYNLTDMSAQMRVDWLGYQRDSDGVLYKTEGSQGAPFAFGFEAPRSDGTSRYVWVYKCEASDPGLTAGTKQGATINFQSPTVSISIAKRKDGELQCIVDEGDEGVTASILSGFLSTVRERATATTQQ
jgi:phi13 family phage major tail protein